MKSVYRIHDWLRYGLARLGWPGVLGLTLMVAAGLFQRMTVEPLRAAGAELVQRADALTLQARQQHAAAIDRQADLGATLPGAERMPEAVASLFTAARHAGLSLQQGIYRQASEKPASDQVRTQTAHGLTRYQISLPVSGNYPAVRAFIAEALEREPGLALEGMRLSREDMESGEISAEIRFALYLNASHLKAGNGGSAR